MTQTIPHTPSTGEQPEYREKFQVMGEQLVTTVEHLLHEGNVRRIIIKHEGHTVLEIPLTIGVVGVLVAPLLAAELGVSARSATGFRTRSFQSRATGSHPLCDAYYDGWCRHLSPVIRSTLLREEPIHHLEQGGHLWLRLHLHRKFHPPGLITGCQTCFMSSPVRRGRSAQWPGPRSSSSKSFRCCHPDRLIG